MSIEALSWAWGQQAKPGPKLVLLALADHADHEGVCWPGFDGLAAKTGMNRSTVIDNVKVLAEMGLIEVEKRSDRSGHRASNRYILNITKVVKSNVGISDSGETKDGEARRTKGQSKVAKTNVGNSNVGKTNVGFSEAKVGIPDPNLHSESSLLGSPVSTSLRSVEPAEPKTSAGVAKRPPTADVWDAFAGAYQRRYGVEPVRNATVNGQLANFVKRIGADEAPAVAAFYVQSNHRTYVGAKHPVGLLLRDCEGLRTEWATGRTVTETQARQLDRRQSNANAFAALIAEAEAREKANA